MRRRTPPPAPEQVDWETFRRQVFDWRQGQHVSAIGPTGTGKTTLLMNLMDERRYVAAIGTKPKDDNLPKLERLGGYKRVTELPDRGRPPRVMVWPPYRSPADKARQRIVIGAALNHAFRAGGWTVLADEVSYLCRRLRLEEQLLDLWEQGRSNNTSLVAATQRPAWVPLALYSAPTHLFFWRTNDVRDLARIGGLNGTDPEPVQAAVANLPKHHALYLNSDTGQMVITLAPREYVPRAA